MNRPDAVKGAALDVAHQLTQDPARRNDLADDLITLIELMIEATGKSIAVDGESAMNTAEFGTADFEGAYAKYTVGEAMRGAAGWASTEARGADLDRWKDLHDNRYGWNPKCRVCGLRQAHKLDCFEGQAKS